MKNRVTIKQIAEACQMAIPSVSQILNDKGSYRKETREQVQAMAKHLGYRPNAYAQAMQSGRFNAAALVVATTEGLSFFEPQLVLALEDRLAATNRHLIVARLPDERLTDAGYVPRILRELMADGLLIAYNAKVPQKMIELIHELGLPSIYINNDQAQNSIMPDDEGGLATATQHLIDLGHRHIAYADFGSGLKDDPWHYSTLARRNGYLKTMKAAGLSAQLWSEDHAISASDYVPYANSHLRDSAVTAVICYASPYLGAIMLAAAALGKRIPHDLSVITVDISNPSTLGPNLGLLRLPAVVMADAAITALDQCIDGKTNPRMMIPLEFNPGTTVGPPPKS